MNVFAKAAGVALMMSVTGCASTGHRHVDAIASNNDADVVGACERLLYRSADTEKPLALRCAAIADVWQ